MSDPRFKAPHPEKPSLPPGDELSRCVAQEVFGHTIATIHNRTYAGPPELIEQLAQQCAQNMRLAAVYSAGSWVLRDYTSQHDLWWPIVEEMSRRQGYDNQGFAWDGPKLKAAHRYLNPDDGPPHLTMLGTESWYVYLELFGMRYWFVSETPGHAVCLAALMAVRCGVRPVLTKED